MTDKITKTLTILTPCYNEVENIDELVDEINTIRKRFSHIVINHLFIDNASNDGTVEKLRNLAGMHSHVQVILNNRNYGHIRSPMYGLFQMESDAVILMASDFQEPINLIPMFIKKWEEGNKIVIGIRNNTEEGFLISSIRKFYYKLINRLSDTPLLKNFTGFGLYDKEVISILKSINDPYPYFRGLISELGFETVEISYDQPMRKKGITKNNFYTLYDMALLGITNHSKVPLRLATFFGFVISFFSFLIGLGYLIYKLLFWERFILGAAPVVIGIFFIGAIQLFFIGIIGEYLGSIHTQVLNRPLVIEKERINI